MVYVEFTVWTRVIYSMAYVEFTVWTRVIYSMDIHQSFIFPTSTFSLYHHVLS